MTILTGDTHGEFERIETFCAEYDTSIKDVLVILGDAGINYWLDQRDTELKERLSELPVTLFCVHGNHEERPEEVPGYEPAEWRGGEVWVQPDYPNLLFAQDGSVYDFDGRKVLVIGGAYSVDKQYRLANGMQWFPTEQPDAYTKDLVERRLDQLGWRIDTVFSHTVPLSYIPQYALLPNIDQRGVDRSTEEWLEQMERRLVYESWYAGHFHVTCDMGRVHILYEDYEELYTDLGK